MNRIESEIELASGMAESLGHLYTIFDKNRRSQLMTKIYSGGLFARYFGQSLGRLFKYITPDLQEEIFGHMQSNPQFADGISTGLGYIFRSLDTIFQREILQKAQINGEMSRGLGFGFGLRFPLMDQKEMIETFSKADTDPEFDNGFGMGLASLFNKYRNHLPHDFFESQVVSWGKGHPEFMIGFGIMCVWLALDDLPKEVTSLMENEGGELAYGASLGYGMYLLYMMPEAQNFILSKEDESIKFDLGLGSGLGIVFKHLSRNVKDGNLALARGDKRSEYDVGIGFGIGYMWQYQNQDVVSESFLRMASNNGFAFGLGYGLGYTFEYLSAAARDQLFDEADKNLEFDIGLGFGSGFARGLGQGLGSIYGYLSEEIRSNIVLKYLQTNSQFATGLGIGVGKVFKVISQDLTNEAWTMASLNGGFARGLGHGLGSIRPFLSADIVKIIFSKLRENIEFARGLGHGLGSVYQYLQEETRNQILKKTARAHEQFGKGLGFSLGHHFAQLSEKLLAYVTENQEFGYCLGEGIGRNFGSLDAELQEQILSGMQERQVFGLGVGRGLGESFNLLDPTLAQEILADAFGDDSIFAYALGEGIGRNFVSLRDKVQDDIILKLSNMNSRNPSIIKGLKVGLQHSFEYLDKHVVEKLTDTKEDILHVDADYGTSKNILKISQEDYDFNYDSFPVIGLNPEKIGDPFTSYDVKRDMNREEIAFLGQRQHACICFIDMINSTKITSVLDNVELARYYSVFLNSMASIAKNYGAKIIKNAGDCLIYYFPDTSDKSNLQSFRNVLDCSLTMISAHRVINAKLLEEKLPSLNYRISADYGEVEFARMQSSNTDDLFGTAMNKCAKINSKAPPNGIVIGEELFKIIRPFEDKYSFITVDESVPGIDGKYLIFRVTNKDNRKTLNPFNKKSQTDRNKFI